MSFSGRGKAIDVGAANNVAENSFHQRITFKTIWFWQ